jgi:hypothetical protein
VRKSSKQKRSQSTRKVQPTKTPDLPPDSQLWLGIGSLRRFHQKQVVQRGGACECALCVDSFLVGAGVLPMCEDMPWYCPKDLTGGRDD